MKLERQARTTKVTLSRRNVLALLHKLEMEGSARSIFTETDEGVLIVKVESDAEHYAERPDPPGEMHPDTEQFVTERTTA